MNLLLPYQLRFMLQAGQRGQAECTRHPSHAPAGNHPEAVSAAGAAAPARACRLQASGSPLQGPRTPTHCGRVQNSPSSPPQPGHATTDDPPPWAHCSTPQRPAGCCRYPLDGSRHSGWRPAAWVCGWWAHHHPYPPVFAWSGAVPTDVQSPSVPPGTGNHVPQSI